MLGYWDEPDRTAEAIDPARWMHTGDLAVMDEDGYVNIVGRIKDMIIRGGENVYPREVEEFLYGHPDIVDVQVIGIPDERYGEEIMAWVRVREGASVDVDGVRAYCEGPDCPLQDPAIRAGGRRVPDDRHRQGPEVQDPRRIAGAPRHPPRPAVTCNANEPPAQMHQRLERYDEVRQMGRTFWASSPLRPGATSNSTFWPSSSDL